MKLKSSQRKPDRIVIIFWKRACLCRPFFLKAKEYMPYCCYFKLTVAIKHSFVLKMALRNLIYNHIQGCQ